MKTSSELLDFEIDKLTNSIENTLTGEVFDTEVFRITLKEEKLTKEKREIDFIIKSEPWSEKDLTDFRELMKKIKSRNKTKNNSKPAQVEKTI